MHIERLTRASLLGAVALLLSYLETMLPLPLGIPGIKMGLANLAVLVACYVSDYRTACLVALVKVLVSALLFGSPMTLAYSAAGTLLSLAALWPCTGPLGLGPLPTSMISGAAHNVGQLLMCALLLDTASVFALLVPLVVAGLVMGALVGAVVQAVLPALAFHEDARPRIDTGALHLEPGRRVAFVGANGSGKTSCALQLAGLVPGVDGVPVTAGTGGPSAAAGGRTPPTAENNVAMLVFQNPDDQGVRPLVQDDMAFGLENRGVPADAMAQRVARALDEVGIAPLALRNVTELSGGEKQGAALAGVLAMDPALVIFDEATSMLDGHARSGFEALAGRLAAEGLAVIQITQIPEEAFSADEVVVFSEGAIVWQGGPDELLARPELMERWQVGLPPVARLCACLREQGVSVPMTNNMDELEDVLWRLYATT